MKSFRETLQESKFKIGDEVKPLRKMKRKQSNWTKSFGTGKTYTVKEFDKLDGEDVLILDDDSVVYMDEVVKV